MKSNPFATRFTRPGQLPWISGRGPSPQALAEKFHAMPHRQAAVVGPHGSGKSTLVHHLLRRLSPPGSLLTISVRRGEVGWRAWYRLLSKLRSGDLLVIDGLDGLPLGYRLAAVAMTRRRGVWLLATGHAEYRQLPTLHTTQADPEVAVVLVERLLHEAPQRPLPSAGQEQLAHLLRQEQGNLREVFMRLYDRYEDARESTRVAQRSLGLPASQGEGGVLEWSWVVSDT